MKHSSCILFADDTEIHYSDGDINKASNCVNGDLDNMMSSWVSSNQMVVHPGKSEVMKIGTSTFLTRSVLLKIYKQTMLPIFDYGCSVWMECSNSMIDSPERLQNHTQS